MEEFNITTIRNDFRTWFQNNKDYQIDTKWQTKTIPNSPFNSYQWREKHTFHSTLFCFQIQFSYIPKEKAYFFEIRGNRSRIPLSSSEWEKKFLLLDPENQSFFAEKYARMVQEKQLGGSYFQNVYYVNSFQSIDDLVDCMTIWKECIQNDYQSIFEEERHMIEGLQKQCSISFEELFTDFNETVSKEEFMEWSTEFTKELGTPK